jgi:hypothetical protein
VAKIPRSVAAWKELLQRLSAAPWVNGDMGVTGYELGIVRDVWVKKTRNARIGVVNLVNLG